MFVTTHTGRGAPVGLVGGDEVGEVDGGQGLELGHVRVQLLLQLHVQHPRALHRGACGWFI